MQLMAKATRVDAVDVVSSYELDNEHWLVVPCCDYDTFKDLPRAVKFDGRLYGRTGWNSDSGQGYYCTGKQVALEA